MMDSSLDRMKIYYGSDPTLLEERRTALWNLLKFTGKWLGKNRQVVVCRAPGRVNLMGRHVDHRGGYVNVMAINREVLLAAAPRDDDMVVVRNLDESQFQLREFRIGEVSDRSNGRKWIDFVDSTHVKSVLDSAPADWIHYLQAPLIRLQHELGDSRLKGMDCVMYGNIPMGAGLASSSALVVAFAQATVALNGLRVNTQNLVDLCSESEWFVGSRGGSADHAAICTSKLGYISRVGFFPLRVDKQFKLPTGLNVVVTNSGEKAVKTAAAGQIFNQRIACYNAGEILLKQAWFPAREAQYLRDINPDYLKVNVGDFYRAIGQIPDRPSKWTLKRLLRGEDSDTVDRIFASHSTSGYYDLRGVILFGISECMRSDSFYHALAGRDLNRVAGLIKASHNGDRRWRFVPDGLGKRYLVRTDPKSLEKLASTNAEIMFQPGRYACSTRTIDRLVDVSRNVPGVIGAQLIGAGLGGCFMVLVNTDSISTLKYQLNEALDPQGPTPNSVFTCHPVAGAGLLKL